MDHTDQKLTTVVSWMTGLIAVLVGLGLPLFYGELSYIHQAAALETEVEINARIVTQLINANPDMWRYEELRLTELMKRRPSTGTPEIRRIRDLHDKVIAESVESLPAPVMTRTGVLMDSGRKVGTIEISCSLRPFVERTGMLALLSILLGLAAFITLRTVPLRMLRKAIRSLYEEKEQAQVTLRSIGDGVITTDAHGNVMLLNGVAETLTGWMLAEAQGRRLDEVFSIINQKTRAVCENPVESVLREMRAIELANNTILISRDGTERVIADSAAPIQGTDGGIIGVVLVFRDVTEKYHQAEELQKMAKLESLGILAGGIAHDFNNILTAIIGNISLAQLMVGPEDQLHERLYSTMTACHRAKDLTYQLLTFAKGGMPVKATISLAELIHASANFALSGSNVSAEIHLVDDLLFVSADPGQINQVLQNLIINAMEAMAEGGMVTICADRTVLSGEEGLPLPAGEYVRIAVQDCGPGIPPEVIGNIFDPYFTTKKSGSGLGLATCYSISKSHGGHITVESEPGKGATFRFYLPAISEPGRVKSVGTSEEIIRGRGRVLVMDDEELVRGIVGEMLTTLGYEAAFAKAGAEAIERYVQAKAVGKPFAAVILDLTVPGGMGGKETIQKLLELDPNIKAIVSSGYSENPVMSDFAQHGFCGVISKPYDLKQMGHVVHAVLEGGASSDASQP